MGMERPTTGAERVAKRRAALRAQGLRQTSFWLPDVSTPEFAARVAKASNAIDRQTEDAETRAWMDAMIDDVLSDLPPYEWQD
jgi:hypothetical protein